ncbi:type II CAAX prenyl endopeptidase Rce1 family protein [Capnocytophaga sp. ARDL2]|uniref:CPBP family glutamic-type intramembrane protease n=1 Tax=Capnocytophaga sp. ARDL2 TaxID=3238809 RepID=UPI0035574273
MFWILYLLTNITTFYLYYYKKYSKIPYFILLIYSILFIFLHTENYKMDEILKMPFYNILLLFSSQITLTIILGYIRIKSKRLYPTILFHSIYNLTIVLLSILDL